ncbi:hypothetical protein GCM10029963_06130 [Micromonospora andamanensis]
MPVARRLDSPTARNRSLTSDSHSGTDTATPSDTMPRPAGPDSATLQLDGITSALVWAARSACSAVSTRRATSYRLSNSASRRWAALTATPPGTPTPTTTTATAATSTAVAVVAAVAPSQAGVVRLRPALREITGPRRAALSGISSAASSNTA